jgi:hypothetical protein
MIGPWEGCQIEGVLVYFLDVQLEFYFLGQFSVSGSAYDESLTILRALLCSRECVGIIEASMRSHGARYGNSYCSFYPTFRLPFIALFVLLGASTATSVI